MKTSLIIAAAMTTSGCASIVSENTYPVTIDSLPSGANLSITSEDNTKVFEGTGPTTLTLKSGDGYFDGASYNVVATAPTGEVGRGQLTASMDSWYIGNILFGGLIGFLIVDPATGAMYELPESFVVNIPMNDTPSSTEEIPVARLDGGQTISLSDIPEELRGQLVRVEE
ncbi:MAG: hypothetical protein MRY64_11170 [Hyphomonadaceae bacterium]|nr:hypothetical protein [Hyphomonadaceae bacterium]